MVKPEPGPRARATSDTGRATATRFAALRHADTVVDLAFSPDGRYLATGSADSTVSVWHTHTGEPLYPPLKHGHIRFTLRFSPDGAWLAAGGEAGVRLWDVRSGAPALPDLRHEEPVDFFEFSPDGRRLLTQTRSGVVRSFDLTSVHQGPPTMALGKEGGVVTSASFSPDGRRIVTAGDDGTARIWDAATGLERVELEAAWRTVRDRFEAENETGTIASLAWHRQRLHSNERAQQWFAAEFHARQLVALAPADPLVQAELERVLSHRPPPRDPATPPELIDLSAFHNASLTIPWHPGPQGNHLASLPRGIQTFGGTGFDVRGLIQVMNGPLPGSLSYPSRMNGIRIGLTARRLQFLHATMGGQPPEGARVGHYRVRYANGRTEELPSIYGRDARDWHEHPGLPVEAEAATIAWTGTNPATAIAGTRGIRLFKWTWENPAPVDVPQEVQSDTGPLLPMGLVRVPDRDDSAARPDQHPTTRSDTDSL